MEAELRAVGRKPAVATVNAGTQGEGRLQYTVVDEERRKIEA